MSRKVRSKHLGLIAMKPPCPGGNHSWFGYDKEDDPTERLVYCGCGAKGFHKSINEIEITYERPFDGQGIEVTDE